VRMIGGCQRRRMVVRRGIRLVVDLVGVVFRFGFAVVIDWTVDGRSIS
jgi:hypothetical protein